MPKLKTKSAAKKRFRQRAGGLKRKKAFRSHLLTGKKTKRKRQLRRTGTVSKGDEKKVKKLLPYL